MKDYVKITLDDLLGVEPGPVGYFHFVDKESGVKRNKPKPLLKLKCWVEVDGGVKADGYELLTAVRNSTNSEADMRRRMGASFGKLQDAIDGLVINPYSAMMIEHALEDENAPKDPPHCGPNE